MQYDYYAYRKEQLSDRLNKFEKASAELDQAKRDLGRAKGDEKQAKKQAVKNAEKNLKIAAQKILEKIEKDEKLVEPHLPYLWYEALGRDLKNSICDAWQKLTTDQKTTDQNSKLAKQIQSLKKEQDAFEFTPKLDDLNYLPSLSFMLRISFKLRKPYLSKDDRAFHLLDNPVRKDKVFQTPMVSSTSWKGALHNAMIQQLVEWWCNIDDKTSRTHRKELLARRISIARLFGTEKGIDIDDRKLESYLDSLGDDHLARWYRRYIQRYIASSGFFAGRLYFYPTFFDKIGLEVINPHDRKKGTGKNPILIECVPIGATGELVILYVPFWRFEKNQVTEEERKKEEKKQRNEVAADLKLVAEGVQAMLTVYGFGAKTSSGFGVAALNDVIQFGIRADWSCLEEISTSNQKLEFLDDDGTLKREFINPDGSFKTEKQYKAFLQGQGRKHNEKLYKEAKKWRETRNDNSKSIESFRRREFISFESLMITAEECCNQQIKGGESNV